MLYSALIFGLIGGFHCIGMCGPIAFVLPIQKSKSLSGILQISLYHFGRLLTYALMGGLFGLIGRGLYLFGLQQKISIAVGITMILVVIFPKLGWFGSSKLLFPIYKLIGKVKQSLGVYLKRRAPSTLLTIGFLNGFLPCGLVYMALFASIAAGNHPLHGSLYMFVFGLGTVPLMTVAIFFSKILTANLRQKIQKLIPVMVFIIGLLFVLRGLGLGIPYVSPRPMTDREGSKIECHQ